MAACNFPLAFSTVCWRCPMVDRGGHSPKAGSRVAGGGGGGFYCGSSAEIGGADLIVISLKATANQAVNMSGRFGSKGVIAEFVLNRTLSGIEERGAHPRRYECCPCQGEPPRTASARSGKARSGPFIGQGWNFAHQSRPPNRAWTLNTLSRNQGARSCLNP